MTSAALMRGIRSRHTASTSATTSRTGVDHPEYVGQGLQGDEHDLTVVVDVDEPGADEVGEVLRYLGPAEFKNRPLEDRGKAVAFGLPEDPPVLRQPLCLIQQASEFSQPTPKEWCVREDDVRLRTCAAGHFPGCQQPVCGMLVELIELGRPPLFDLAIVPDLLIGLCYLHNVMVRH